MKKKKECGAYCGGHNSFVCCGDRLYYDNYGNYTDEDGNQGVQAEIYSMKTDGSDKKCLFTLKDVSIEWFRIHRGYIYYLMNPVISDGGVSYDREHSVIMRVPLDGKEADAEVFVPLYEYGVPHKDIHLRDARLYGNNMYLNIELLGEAKAETTDGASNPPKEIKVNLETKERSEISAKLKNPISFPILFNNKLVYIGNFDNDTTTFNVYECDLDGGNERKVLTLDKSTSIMQFILQ